MAYIHTELAEYLESRKDKNDGFTAGEGHMVRGPEASLIMFFLKKIDSLEDEINKLKKANEIINPDSGV